MRELHKGILQALIFRTFIDFNSEHNLEKQKFIKPPEQTSMMILIETIREWANTNEQEQLLESLVKAVFSIRSLYLALLG